MDRLTSQGVLSPSSSPCWGLPLSTAEGSARPRQVSNSGHISPTNRNPAASHSVRQGSEGKVRVLPAILLLGGDGDGSACQRSKCELLAERVQRVLMMAVHCCSCPNVPAVSFGLAQYPRALLAEANLMNRAPSFTQHKGGQLFHHEICRGGRHSCDE